MKARIIVCGKCWETRIYGAWQPLLPEHVKALCKRMDEWEAEVTLCPHCSKLYGVSAKRFEKSIPIIGECFPN